jgi:prolyl oligopeptidase
MAQRPELFRAVLCQVPLTDMLRFHRFGIANIWTQEYGSPDDPDMFPFLRAYSPVHNVAEGVRYPALLVTASANDARTDPVHARKFYAVVHHAALPDPTRPVLLRIEDESGHTGAVTIAQMADQYARSQGFLMAMLGMTARSPSGGPTG